MLKFEPLRFTGLVVPCLTRPIVPEKRLAAFPTTRAQAALAHRVRV
jgi:hypothetical protein